MNIKLLSTPQTLELLLKLRQTSAIDYDLSRLDVDDRAYFEAELAVRKVTYNNLEKRLPEGTNPWMREFCICYRDLFTDSKRALQSLEKLMPNCPNILDLPLRLEYWHAHLLILTGNVAKGIQELSALQFKVPHDYLWRTETLVITALGHFFAGRSNQALLAHYACHSDFDLRPDLFLQTFNSAMATRVALKLCDANAFEFFSQKLESLLLIENDSRFRLRHACYRALILNQLGEHEAAERHWNIGDQMWEQTESNLERGHYLLYRGLSHALKGEIKCALHVYDKAYIEFESVGSPPHFISELEIARKFAELSDPVTRGMFVKRTFELSSALEQEFNRKSKLHTDSIKALYADASQFCGEILNGNIPETRSNEFTSVTLSIIDNVSRSENFAKGLSHFRLLPNFIAAVKQTGITEQGVSDALQSVLKVRTYFDGKFTLSAELATLEKSPEYKILLEFASTLCDLGKNADRLFAVEARLKETQRATFLLHDLRYFNSDLMRLAHESSNPDLEMLSGKLNDLIEGHLHTIKTGISLETPGLVGLSSLLKRVGQITAQMTGKTFLVNGDSNVFLWISEPLLERVLFNIIKNGLDAGSGESPVRVTVKKEDQRLIVLVSDNGSGIEVSILESIADLSKQVVATSKKEGTGLGLRSAFECAQAIGADVRLTSSSQNGSEFEISIPLLSSNVLSGEIGTPEILVIDDSRSVINAWKEFALNEDLKILACNPIESIRILNNSASSLKWVVLDYDMKLPNCNGATLAESISSLGVKIALSTGFKPDELPADARAINWDAVLSKEPQHPDSFSVQNILPITAVILNKPSQIRALRHDIRNELTPLKTIYKFVKNKIPEEDQKGQRYIELFGDTLNEVESILERARQKELHQEFGG